MTDEQAEKIIRLLEKLESTTNAICSYIEMEIDRRDEMKAMIVQPISMHRNRGDYDE